MHAKTLAVQDRGAPYAHPEGNVVARKRPALLPLSHDASRYAGALSSDLRCFDEIDVCVAAEAALMSFLSQRFRTEKVQTLRRIKFFQHY